MSIIKRSIITVLALCLAGTAVAQDGPPTQDGDHPRPPREAIEACGGLIDGDACSFDSPHGAVDGSCWAPSEDLPLACKPEGMEGPPPQR